MQLYLTTKFTTSSFLGGVVISIEAIELDFREKACSKLRLISEGKSRYRVSTPFLFDDGDHLSIVFKRENGYWILSDEGHTYMHLTYSMDAESLMRGTRQEIISRTLSSFEVLDRDGELLIKIQDEQYGNALYSFIQALMKISDVSYLSREIVKSTFLEDFRSLLINVVPEERRKFNWYSVEHDPKGNYAVDCQINGMDRPIFVYGLPNDDKTRDATIALLQFEKWSVPFRSLAIFENQESITRKVLARFSDICEKLFSSLGDRERIERYIKNEMMSM